MNQSCIPHYIFGTQRKVDRMKNEKNNNNKYKSHANSKNRNRRIDSFE